MGYEVDPASGTLTEMAGSPFVTGRRLRAHDASPSGDVLYAAWGEQVTRFAADPAMGGLVAAASQPLPRDANPSSVTVDAVDQRLFVLFDIGNRPGHPGGAHLYVYRTGSGQDWELLEQLPLGPPFSMTLQVAPKGRFVYVLDRSGGRILAFAIEAGKDHLQPVAGSPVPTATRAFGFQVVQAAR